MYKMQTDFAGFEQVTMPIIIILFNVLRERNICTFFNALICTDAGENVCLNL